ADGARLARMATAEEPLVWELRVPPRSLSLELDILLAGRMRLHANDHLIYEDPPSTPAVVRRARIEISDRRLWEAGTLRLSFADAGGGAAGTALQVAELRTRVVRDVATGIVPDTEAVPLPEPVDVTTRTERSAPPDARLTLLVVPVVLADAPLALSRDQIAEVCFGEGHRQTPGPQPRLTSGSVREILHELSGGRTHLVGEVADPKTEHIQAVELTGADGPSRIAALVERALAAHGREYDVVLV